MEVFFMKNKKKKKNFYPFTNDIVFCYVLTSHPELAKELLELILGFEIDHVDVVDEQKVLNYTADNKSVRLDVYMKNDSDVFDVEMQSFASNDLERRMRYYQAANACDDLKRGDDYNKLKNCYVIFICTYDPFKEGEAVYRFRMLEEEDRTKDYDDGARNIVINATSDDERISPGLRNLLSYIRNGDPVDNLTNRIQNVVDEANQSSTQRRTIMTIEEKMNLISRQSKEEGLQEGNYLTMFSTVDHLMSKGTFDTEEDACEFLGYDFNEYMNAKKQHKEKETETC